VHATYAANGPEIGKNTPRGRPGQPAELAPAYVLLASNDGSPITDTMTPVTGGRPML
jgi:NAD(P)-dependent dehydrogenase (short-subunit alcohol dehydrogenase family)